MNKQEYKIEYLGREVFFFAHSFKTALDHAHDFIERNRGKYKMMLFMRNTSNFGDTWIRVGLF